MSALAGDVLEKEADVEPLAEETSVEIGEHREHGVDAPLTGEFHEIAERDPTPLHARVRHRRDVP